MQKSLTWKLGAFAFAGLMGLAGSASARPWDREPIQPSREGTPPHGAIRVDVGLRVAHDGRADTGGLESRQRPEPQSHVSRPDSNMGQASHFQMPLKRDIVLRVDGGDRRDGSAPAKLQGGAPVAQPEAAKVYPGRHEHQAAPLPIKTDILLKVSGGGEVGMGEGAGREDDPKFARQQSASEKNAQTLRDPKVYPGRHENIPTVPEMFMKVQKRPSAQGDQAGDKDAP